MERRQKVGLVIAATGLAQFMAALDNLVVTTALPTIREHLHAGLSSLEWTVNAYTLAFATLLIAGAALGDKFGRKRIFQIGIFVFTIASASAALSNSITALVVSRSVQGIGGALMVPLSLTLLSDGVPKERRNFALGIWGALGGLAIAIGPLVGGAVVQIANWQWIFWLNVPTGVVLLLLTRLAFNKNTKLPKQLDLSGLILVTMGLFGLVNGLINGSSKGWTNNAVIASFITSAITLAAFILVERRKSEPMVPLAIFRSTNFSIINAASLLMSFGLFGSVFFLSQYFQLIQGLSPVASGIRILPWTAMPILVTPFLGGLVNKYGGERLVQIGLSLQAVGLGWIAIVIAVHSSYPSLVGAFVIAGVGTALFFVPTASITLESAGPKMEAIASGVNNSLREVGGALGIATLGAVFTGFGGFSTPTAFIDGLRPAITVGALLLACAALITIKLRRSHHLQEGEVTMEYLEDGLQKV